MASSAGSLAAALRRSAKEARSFPRKFVEDATKVMHKGVDKTLRADTGGDASLSNAPGKLRVTRKVSGDSVVTGTVAVAPRSAGRFAWLEKGTDPHAIGKGRHPGTAAKRTWTRAMDPAMRALNREIDRAFDRVTEF
jgi:hypothetical protein